MSRTLRQKKIFSKRVPFISEVDSEMNENRFQDAQQQNSKNCGSGGGCGSGGCGGVYNSSYSSSDSGGNNCKTNLKRCARYTDSSVPFGVDNPLLASNSDITNYSINRINGTCGAFNSDWDTPCVPGNRYMPFRCFSVFMQYRSGLGHPQMYRIFSPMFADTRQLGLSANNCLGRTLCFAKGQEYTITVAPLENSSFIGPIIQTIAPILSGVYFCIDSIGGSASFFLNQAIMNDAIESKGVMPEIVTGCVMMYPGTTTRVVPGTTWPLAGTYQSALAGCMGGYFICIGGCIEDFDSLYPCDDMLPGC